MRVLLFSMPDTMPNFRTGLDCWPNLALCSIAASVGSEHEVVVADLCCKRKNVPEGIREALETVKPHVVGVSAMTFQFHTACGVARMTKEYDHATLLYDEMADRDEGRLFDYIVRHEGEESFPKLLHAIERKKPPSDIPGVSFRIGEKWIHNPPPRSNLDLSKVPLPRRSARLWTNYGIYRRTIDGVETSRGCTLRCKFCSMQGMYGHTFRTYDIERVIADIGNAKRNGARVIGFPDDNITLRIDRFEALCDAIIAAGHDNMFYFVQASAWGIGRFPKLVRKMARAGFILAFLGIENINKRNLKFMKKGDIAEDSKRAIENLHKNNIICIGGIIIGNPDDDEENIALNYDFLRENEVEMYLDQILCPYPKTPLREELLAEGLVTNPDDYRYYNGYWANVRTKHLSSDELQFLKWKYHRMNSLRFRPEPKTISRRLLPVSFVRRFILFPYRRLRDHIRYRNTTDYELYRISVDKAWERCQFFDGKPPSSHLDVGHARPLREPVRPPVLVTRARLI